MMRPDPPLPPPSSTTPPPPFRPHRRRRSDRAKPGQHLGEDIHPLQHAAGFTSSEPTTGTPFERISSREGLEDGWRMVLAKDASDGILQKKTKEFAEHLDDFLTELSESLRSGTYEPDPLLSFAIPKGTSGEVRTLHIPSIRDRVVERAVVNTITHKADLAMSPCSFAYRTGIGTDDAVDHLARLRDAGYRYVLRTDIEDYFPNLNIEDALAALSPIAGCPRTIDLIRLIARPRRARGERRTRTRGIAQGSCLSPLLANLALTDVDRAMGDAGYGYARFAASAVEEGHPGVALYSAGKAASLAAARGWASELAPRNIRVNTLVPGPITSNLRSVLPDELRSQFEEKLADVVLLKRVGDAKEAAAVALFLLSDDASYVTGSSYVVDGGLLMS